VKPPPFRYERAESVEHAVALLREHGDEAKVLAGGQSLVPLLNMRFARPGVVVDVNRIAGLDYIEQSNGHVRVGALVRQSALATSPLVRELLPLVAECLPYVGHFATRNRGTVGGSIAHADPSAELPLVLTVLGGSVVTSAGRTIAAADFFQGVFTTALAPDELIVETIWPTGGTGFAFEELALRHGDFALAMAACAVRDGELRLGIGAVTDRPLLVEHADAEIDEPAATIHASAAYRRELTRVLARRAVERAS
jgi:CO/xanthine dehydrogenase FAD-binding subunit